MEGTKNQNKRIEGSRFRDPRSSVWPHARTWIIQRAPRFGKGPRWSARPCARAQRIQREWLEIHRTTLEHRPPCSSVAVINMESSIFGMKNQNKRIEESRFRDPRSSAWPHAKAWIIHRALGFGKGPRSRTRPHSRAQPIQRERFEIHRTTLESRLPCSSVATINMESSVFRINLLGEDFGAYLRDLEHILDVVLHFFCHLWILSFIFHSSSHLLFLFSPWIKSFLLGHWCSHSLTKWTLFWCYPSFFFLWFSVTTMFNASKCLITTWMI